MSIPLSGTLLDVSAQLRGVSQPSPVVLETVTTQRVTTVSQSWLTSLSLRVTFQMTPTFLHLFLSLGGGRWLVHGAHDGAQQIHGIGRGDALTTAQRASIPRPLITQAMSSFISQRGRSGD